MAFGVQQQELAPYSSYQALRGAEAVHQVQAFPEQVVEVALLLELRAGLVAEVAHRTYNRGEEAVEEDHEEHIQETEEVVVVDQLPFQEQAVGVALRLEAQAGEVHHQVVEEEAVEHLFLMAAAEEELQNSGMLVAVEEEVLDCWKLSEEEEEGLEVTSLVLAAMADLLEKQSNKNLFLSAAMLGS